jgi:hypothetical protein
MHYAFYGWQEQNINKQKMAIVKDGGQGENA